MANLPAPIVSTTKMLKSIKPKHIGQPEHLIIADKSIQAITLGVIFGRGRKVQTDDIPDMQGEVKSYDSITGDFVAYSYKEFADKSREDIGCVTTRKPDVKAAKLYLPSSIADIYIQAMRDAENEGEIMEFALEIGVSRDSNVRGYEWFGRSVLEAQAADDPMEALLKRATQAIGITDESEEQLALEHQPTADAVPVTRKRSVK